MLKAVSGGRIVHIQSCWWCVLCMFAMYVHENINVELSYRNIALQGITTARPDPFT